MNTKVTKDDVIQWALRNGWQLDRWGHLQKLLYGPDQPDDAGRRQPTQKQYRLRLSRIAVRYEIKASHGWVRLSSGYYSHLSIPADGSNLIGLTR